MTWYYAVLAFVAAGGFLFGLAKWGPESSKIFVESAEVTVRIANEQRDDLAAAVERLQERMDTMEDQLRHEREQRRLSNSYARTLAQVLRNHDMAVPPPPAGLDL